MIDRNLSLFLDRINFKFWPSIDQYHRRRFDQPFLVGINFSIGNPNFNIGKPKQNKIIFKCFKLPRKNQREIAAVGLSFLRRSPLRLFDNRSRKKNNRITENDLKRNDLKCKYAAGIFVGWITRIAISDSNAWTAARANRR